MSVSAKLQRCLHSRQFHSGAAEVIQKRPFNATRNSPAKYPSLSPRATPERPPRPTATKIHHEDHSRAEKYPSRQPLNPTHLNNSGSFTRPPGSAASEPQHEAHSRPRPLSSPRNPPHKIHSSSSSSPPPSLPSRPKFNHSALSYHWDTLEPTHDQLIHATKFFTKQTPKFLWSAEKFKTMDYGSSPEICFLGRSNVGKSSLLNALLLRRLANTSSKPGRTRLMNAFAVGPDDDPSKRLVVMDMPGYGKGGRAEWGVQIMKYLEKRKELKRAFLLIDAEHGVKPGDRAIIALMKQSNVPFQIVLAKADKIVFPGSRTPSPGALEARLGELREMMETVKGVVMPDTEDDGGAVGEIIACSSDKWVDGKRMGIDAVRFAMLRAAGLELRPRRIVTTRLPEMVSHEELFAMKARGRG